MDNDVFEKPVKKMAGIGEVLEEAWELYIYNIGVFAVYLIFWLLGNLIINVVLVYLPNIMGHKGSAGDFYMYSGQLRPYLQIFLFILLAYCMCALTRAVMMRYDGEENKFGKVLKLALGDFFRYLLVFLAYFNIILLLWFGTAGGHLMGFFSGLLMHIDYKFRGMLLLAFIIPMVYLMIRYFTALSAVITVPPGQSAFKTSSFLVKGRYGSSLLLILMIAGLASLGFSLLLTTGLLYFENGFTLFIALPFVVCLNVVYFRKLEEYKGAPDSSVNLAGANPVLGLLLGVLMCILPLYVVFPGVPGKIFYGNEYLVNTFSAKMTFPEGLVLKRPAGWFVSSGGYGYLPDENRYYLKKESNQALTQINIYSVLLKDAVFRKDKLNPAEKKKIKNVLGLEDESSPGMCAYLVKDNLKEMNSKGAYPKGIFVRTMKMTGKGYSSEETRVYYYRVVKNMYAIIADYSLRDYTSGYEHEGEDYTENENYKNEQVKLKDAQETEQIEIDKSLAETVLF